MRARTANDRCLQLIEAACVNTLHFSDEQVRKYTSEPGAAANYAATRIMSQCRCVAVGTHDFGQWQEERIVVRAYTIPEKLTDPITLTQDCWAYMRGNKLVVDFDKDSVLVLRHSVRQEPTFSTRLPPVVSRTYHSLLAISPQALVRLAHAGIWPETIVRDINKIDNKVIYA